MTIRIRPWNTLLATALLILPWVADAQVVIGIVEDGPRPRPIVQLSRLEAEIRGLAGDEFDVQMPADKRLNGGWSVAGVRAAIRQLLNDPDVDIVITTGLISSHEAAHLDGLSKPLIATIVADARLQDFPERRMTGRVVSGKRNFVYVARVRTAGAGRTVERTDVDESIDTFHDAVGFRHLAVILDETTIEAMPKLATVKSRQAGERLGVRTTVIPFVDSVEKALRAIPAEADAVLVGPLLRLGNDRMRALADGLIQRKLPSFSVPGRTELGNGILMASGGRDEDAVRYARRLALNVQRILLGDAPEEIDVRIADPQRLAINMRTAEAIGFYPRYAVLADAEQLFGDELDEGEALSLRQAMLEALKSNLALNAAAYDPLLAGEDRRLARAQLLPQLGLGVRAVRIDEDRANPVVQSERSVDAEITGSQVVFADDVLAGMRIAAYLEDAARHGYDVEALDTLQAAAQAYLVVLRARSLERVQRSNLETTRANLELALVRQSIGASGRGDVLRWESQLATDRQNLVAAESDRRVALTTFNQVLNRPKHMPFKPPDDDVSSSIAVFEDPRFRAFIDNAAVWRLFQDFLVGQTFAHAPELKEIDAFLSAQQRQIVSAKRKFYLPELTLGGSLGTNLSRGGAGSDLSLTGLDDESWTLALSASWPLFSSGALRARLNKERFSMRQLRRSRAALAEQLETRTLVALHRAAGTYPSLEFSSEAAAAASENLGLVIDAYRTGAVNVTELIDAQNAALAAELRAVDARYAYLIDAVDVLRSTGSFALLVEPEGTEEWFQAVESYIRDRGAQR